MRFSALIQRLWLGLLCLLPAAVCAAHETDQFLMPPYGEAQFADLGPYFSDFFVEAVAEGITKANAAIRDELDQGHPDEDKLRRLRSPEALAKAVRRALPDAVFFIEGLERKLPSKAFAEQYPGQITIYKKHFKDGMHTGLHAPWDPRIVSRLFKAGTVNLYGAYLGTDKLGHFIDMGYHYYGKYREGLEAGETTDQAMARAVAFGTDGFPLFAEKGVLGKVSSGAYSNADMASNYVGCLFYRNLTETVDLAGRPRPPMATLDEDGLWRRADFVSKDNDGFFACFISDHFNEALNPSLFDKGMRKRARKAIRKRRANLLKWYADEDGNPRPPEYFTHRAAELATYEGQDYGHSGQLEELQHLGNTADRRE